MEIGLNITYSFFIMYKPNLAYKNNTSGNHKAR